MGLDAVGLQNVGVDGALSQEIDALQLLGLVIKDLNKFLADDFALGFGIGNPGQLVKEPIHGIHIDQVRVHFIPENLDNLFRLALAQQAVVDVHADQLLADGLDQQGGHHAGVHAAAEGKQNLLAANLGANLGNLFLDESIGKLRGGDSLHGRGTDICIHI